MSPGRDIRSSSNKIVGIIIAIAAIIVVGVLISGQMQAPEEPQTPTESQAGEVMTTVSEVPEQEAQQEAVETETAQPTTTDATQTEGQTQQQEQEQTETIVETTTQATQTTTQSPTQTVQTQTETQTEVQEPEKPEITLVILTRHPGDIIQKTKELFLNSDVAKQHNIVDLQFISVPPGLWARTAEAKSVDVGWGGGPTLFDTLYLEGLLAPLETQVVLEAINQIPDTLAGVPLKKTGPDGKIYWVSAAISSFGFTVNTELAEMYGLPIPQSWRDLAGLEMARILVELLEPPLGIADPTTSTSNTRMYEIILQTYGWDEGWRILTLMAANAHIYGGSGDVRDAVIRGERIVGITIDFYGYTAQLKNPACIYISPPGETIVNGDPIALLKTAQNPEAAQAFIAWVLTEGQKIWLDKDINRLPSNPSVFNTPEGSQRPDLKESFDKIAEARSIDFNDTLALSYEFMMQQYFKATLVDQHAKLQEAWALLVKSYLGGIITEEDFQRLRKMLTDPIEFTDPLTGQKVMWSVDVAVRLNSEFFAGNTGILDNLLKEWRDAAAEKYQRVIDELGG